MGQQSYDLTILGGGISGCLLLSAVRLRWPQASVQLIEKQERLGGNHTWCFHEADVPLNAWAWLRPLISKEWPSYEVKFPQYQRQINSKYFAIRSEDLHQKMLQNFSENIHLSRAAKASDFPGSMIIDCRGWPPLAEAKNFGYQKFVGLEVELESPHGLQQVTLKDVSLPQADGYRFFYLLPWDEKRLLVEDTYYSNHAGLNVAELDAGIRDYIAAHGWKIKKVHRREVGCLPLALYKNKAVKNSNSDSALLRLGAASGVLNPVTGYTLPQTLQSIQALLENPQIEFQAWKKTLAHLNAKYENQFSYLRLLNRMMFLAAEPEKRFEILQRFYKLSPNLISHFYSAQLTSWEKARLLLGKPPVSVARALKVLRDESPHMEKVDSNS